MKNNGKVPTWRFFRPISVCFTFMLKLYRNRKGNALEL